MDVIEKGRFGFSVIRQPPITQRDLILGVSLPICPLEIPGDCAIDLNCRGVVLKLEVNAARLISCIGSVGWVGRCGSKDRQGLLKLTVSGKRLGDIHCIAGREYIWCNQSSRLEGYIVILVFAQQLPHCPGVV